MLSSFNLYNMFAVKQVLFPPLYGWRNQGLDIVTQRSDRPGIQSQVPSNHHAVLPTIYKYVYMYLDLCLSIYGSVGLSLTVFCL